MSQTYLCKNLDVEEGRQGLFKGAYYQEAMVCYW